MGATNHTPQLTFDNIVVFQLCVIKTITNMSPGMGVERAAAAPRAEIREANYHRQGPKNQKFDIKSTFDICSLFSA
jgi:hypothetical protein